MAEPLFLLDSNICIYILADGGGAPARRLAEQARGSVVTSAICFAEVMRGARHGLSSPGAERLFQAVAPLPFGTEAARAYAGLRFRRGSFDRLIAAHAMALGLVLVTANTRDFADIPGLRVEDWTQ
ncbi:twitching motility protein PilT [alpha proteobacterium AAP81b]|nr:twitching motility protein PilT [alpha proteobacterium AAP81b]